MQQYKSPLINTLSLSLCRVCALQDADVAKVILHATEQEPVTSDRTFALDIPLTVDGESGGAPLPPSVVALTAEDAETEGEVSVTYWVRLLITKTKAVGAKEGSKHWSTHPIVITPPAGEGGSV